MGSDAYGVATDSSDLDFYGFCIPPKGLVFPTTVGEIPGFGTQVNRFAQWQEHHVFDPDAHSGKGQDYDFVVFSIVKYFQLCMENNPNMIESLFTPEDCVRHITGIGQLVRDNRRAFLHKGSWNKFRGYAYSQLNKMSGKSEKSKRYALVEKYGYDTKFAYHVVRLICEVEQILLCGDIDLRSSAELLKSIRRGEWLEQDVRDWFKEKAKSLEPLYVNSTVVPNRPDEAKLKQLLMNCLEEHYGSLTEVVTMPDRDREALREISRVLGGIDLWKQG